MKEENQNTKKLTKDKIAAGLYIFKYIKPYRWYFITGMIALVIGSLIFMVFPGAAGEMANVVVPNYTDFTRCFILCKDRFFLNCIRKRNGRSSKGFI